MARMEIVMILFATVAIVGGAVAAQFDLVSDSAMLVGLAVGMVAMGIGAYKQSTTSG